MIASWTGFYGLDLTPLELVLPYDYKSPEFKDNQTICMVLDSNFNDLLQK